MLTSPQIALHWSHHYGWGRVCAVNFWQGGTKLRDSAVKASRSEWHARVWAVANRIAYDTGRSVGVDQMRKGVYCVALGSVKSLTDFNNADLDRVLALFRILINPEDLKAIADFSAYQKFDATRATSRAQASADIALPEEPGERRRHLHALRDVPAPVLQRLLLQRFHNLTLEEMPLAQLRQLTTTLKNRRDYNVPVTQPF